MSPIILNEPFRAVFYAPYYVAEARGAFARQGLALRIETAGDPNAAAGNLLSGRADVAWSGPMRPMLERSRDPASPLRTFCAVVMRDPFLLVGRGERPGFRIEDLATLRIGVTAEVPTPWWCLQDDIRRAGLRPEALDLVQGRSMAENAEAVLDGEIDVALLFEPFASRMEARGGAVWYAAANRGPTAYSALYAAAPRIEERRDAMLGMVRALAEALDWVEGAAPEAIAEAIAPRFADLDPSILLGSVRRYKGLGLWSTTPVLPREALDRLAGAMISSGAMTHHPGYESCIDHALVRDALGAGRVGDP
ncbi:ABC transporter substrate-binding protein [Roseomonas populi]|uniref:Thiamine pyrimidine synthase n=1 Tax=Roseomonas populi TaxID=3121582 RepID=A0ABT1X6N2_9PROT|nr:ABC transporter substrate-binding protein [Roseomonas pecuniae]MCR0983759.1 ABC transporter substrate-binding protein [Roseomonas pecuniae]